jgi:phage/plasmid-like protein (TIGR03299 family)
MSHNLFINEKGEASFVGIQPAWHGLGKVLNRPFTAEEALREGGLDFDVTKTKLVTETGISVPRHFATVRQDTQQILGVVGMDYKVVQNRECFNFFDPIIDRGEAVYHSAGVLGKGEVVWIMAKLPDYLQIAGKESVDLYVVIFTSHDTSRPLSAMLTPVAVVCNNTLTAAIQKHQGMVRIKHTSGATGKLAVASELLGTYSKLSQELNEAFNTFAQKKVSGKEVLTFVNNLFPLAGADQTDRSVKMTEKTRLEVMTSIETGVGQQEAPRKGTVYGLFNGVTYWLDHVRQYNSDRRPDDSKKLKSIWFGDSARIRQDAFDLCSKML